MSEVCIIGGGVLGREIFNRRLPEGYADFSHAMAEGPNGHYFLRVSSADLRRADGTHVHTVRDVVIEVDASGRVVDEWRLFEILDPNRSIVLCLMREIETFCRVISSATMPVC